MVLEYISLFMLIASAIIVIYAALYIHDIPYQIAKKRRHPQTEAIHVGCWLSLFTLHALWPIIFIWAVSNTNKSIALAGSEVEPSSSDQKSISEMRAAIDQLQSQVDELQVAISGKRMSQHD